MNSGGKKIGLLQYNLVSKFICQGYCSRRKKIEPLSTSSERNMTHFVIILLLHMGVRFSEVSLFQSDENVSVLEKKNEILRNPLGGILLCNVTCIIIVCHLKFKCYN